MTYKGCRVRREQSMSDRSQTLQYHWVDRNGWMVHSPVLREKYTIFSRVLVHCDCSKSFRIGDRVKLAVDNMHRRSKMQMNRWINRGARGKL